LAVRAGARREDLGVRVRLADGRQADPSFQGFDRDPATRGGSYSSIDVFPRLAAAIADTALVKLRIPTSRIQIRF
jgi:hypothetical protein